MAKRKDGTETVVKYKEVNELKSHGFQFGHGGFGFLRLADTNQ